ncbi:MAG: hypothetical protein ACTSWE_02405 [Promethearchaeota archaeon]
MNVNQLFFELSHDARYKILRETSKKQWKHSELEKKFDLPGPEITRHMKRLMKNKLIKKNLDNSYYRTNFGWLINKSLDFFEVNIKFRDFINSHDISVIPAHLLLNLGVLKNCKLFDQTMENIERWSQIILEAKQFIWSITEQTLDRDLPIMQKKIINQKIKIRSILHVDLIKKYVQTEEWEKYIEGPKPAIFRELSNKAGIPQTLRKLHDQKIVLLITESKVLMFFSDYKKIDYSECLYSEKEETVIAWAKELFESYWKRAEPVSKEELLL